MENKLILEPIPYEWGYVSQDNQWMAVPFAENFMVIKNDQQIKSFKTLRKAKEYILRQVEEQPSPIPEKPKRGRPKKTIIDFMN